MAHRGRSRVSRILSIVGLIALIVACGSDDDGGSGADGDEQLQVVASTSVIAQLVQEVGGDMVDVETLIVAGVDPHTFELAPGDVQDVVAADLIFINGLELDDYIAEDAVDAGDDVEVIVVTDGVDLLESGDHHEHEEDANHEDEHEDEHDEVGEHEEDEGEEHEDEDDHEHDEDDADEHDDHEHGEFDPHVWQDPIRVKVMVANIADALADADPDNADAYRDNAATYEETLDETDAEIRGLIDALPEDNRKIVTNHEAFAYFADRYGLEIVGTVIPGTSSEADPSAGDIAELSELIEHEGVKAIFAEALIDPKVAESLAADTGVEIVYGLYSDQVGEEGSGAETVDGMLLANAEKISAALQ